ncbi:MAG: restriction endonuclease [Clostridia bacterium]|nr:restriction endonuclease [Clostridia bacterium]
MYLSDVKSGVDFERYVMDLLLHSRMCVEDTKRSHDYGADLVVRYNFMKYCVQCKWSRNPVGVRAIQEVLGSLVIYNAHRGVVVTNSVFTAEARRLAIMNNVILFDGPGSSPYVSDDSEMGLDYYLLDRLQV